MDGYRLGKALAEGRFGIVYSGFAESTGERVAIKKIYSRRPPPGYTYDPWSRSASREIEVLSVVAHEHVVALLSYRAAPVDGGSTLLVYEYLEWDLSAVLERQRPMPETHVKSVLSMLLQGLAYLHSQGVMHRDIKPTNVLLHGTSGILKIADFGSARFAPTRVPRSLLACNEGDVGPPNKEVSVVAQGEQEADGCLTREVCTRWYKCPEMLFGAVDYTESVDLWSVGCVIAELLSPEGKPLFPGGSDLEQLCLIFQALGTPREEEWPEVHNLPDYSKVEFRTRDPQPLAFEGHQHRSQAAVKLADSMLCLTPHRRLGANDALHAEFFCMDPQAVEPQCLIDGLVKAPTGEHEDSLDDEIISLGRFGAGSDSSFDMAPDAEFEPVPIETTACGLWNDAAFDGEDPVAGTGHCTPPPPGEGGHRFKSRA